MYCMFSTRCTVCTLTVCSVSVLLWYCGSVNIHICACTYVYSLITCVCAPFTSCIGEGAHMYVHVFPHHHLLMQSAIMCTAPLISLLCMVTVLWKSRDFCTAAGAPSRNAWSCNTSSSMPAPSLCAVKASYSLSGFWHLPLATCSLPSPVWLLGIATTQSLASLWHCYSFIGIPTAHLFGFLESWLCCVHLYMCACIGRLSVFLYVCV